MYMKKFSVIFMGFMLLYFYGFSQSNTTTTGNTGAASKEEATPVNFYTGIPAISVPIYNYASQSGLNFGVSLDYFAGGVKVNELPTSSGLGWNMSAGGVVTRTVRGIPDDCEVFGFLYHQIIPNDPRASVTEYNKNCIDAEQDVFQYNFAGRSGKFYIGKDSTIFLSTTSKIKIQVIKRDLSDDGLIYSEPIENPKTLAPSLYGTINKFIITTEDGNKYFFEEKESQLTYVRKCYQTNAYPVLKYASGWYLTKIVAPMAADSIKILYKNIAALTVPEYRSQSASIVNGIITHTDTSSYYSGIENPIINGVAKVPIEIIFSDYKKLVFDYNKDGQFRYGNYPLLRRIKVQDSVFRYGYMLNWDTAAYGSNSRAFLNGLDQYTETTLKEGYRFTYNSPFFKVANDPTINFNNKKDHWGYYNGANNSKDYVPTVAGIYTGANRNANALAIASSLASIKNPAGGITYYDFENNDNYPVQYTKQSISINAATATQTAISISKILGTQTYFKINFDLSNTDLTTLPIAGNGDLIVTITNTAGTTVLATSTLSMQDIYYSGRASFYCAVPTGNYLLKTNLGAGTTTSIAWPIQVSWYNQSNGAGNSTVGAGIRIKQIRQYDPFYNKTDTLTTYKYVTETGKSSGFIGSLPVYDYDLLSNSPSTKHIVLSNIVNELDYSEGSAVGYSRVEIYKGTVARNLGKQVYEYTNINDEDYDNSPVEYPYMYTKRKDWKWGLPKKILTYDNTGRLIQSTKNIFASTYTSTAANANYRSLKTGQASDYFIGYSTNIAYKDYKSEKYYPEGGRVSLISTLDTFYHPNNSITSNKKDIEYDSNYNVIKVTTPYDKNRNLNIEKRIYYPYNYTVAGAIGRLRDSSIFIPISSEEWIMGDAIPRLVSTSISNFEDQYKFGPFSIPRVKPTAIYTLQTNKPLPVAQIGFFNPAVLIRDTNKIKLQQKMLYDRQFGKLIQTTSLPSGISNSVIYGHKNTKAIAQVSNATYYDVAYTSFEPNSEGNWSIITNPVYDSTTAITGRYSYNLSQGAIQYNS